MGLGLLWIYATVLCGAWYLWRARACALDGWANASMSSGIEGDGSGPPGGGGRSEGDLRARISSPWMQGKIRRWLRHLLVPWQDRNDVAQEVTLQAIRSAHTYDPAKASLERWINRITVNVASHYHDRAHHRREELPGELEEQQDAAVPADVA